MSTTSQTPTSPEEVLNLNSPLTFNNFHAEDIDMGETVNVTLLIDNSGSMDTHKSILNDEIKLMIETMQGLHQAPKIFLSIGTFGSKINVLTGFQPIANVVVPKFNPDEGSTKLYDGCKEFLKNIIRQQQDAMKSGVQTKNIFFVLTDGVDTDSNYDSASEVKKMIDYVMKDEQTMGSFGAVMCGIGYSSMFQSAMSQMGMQKLFVIDSNKSEKEIKKEFKEVFGWLSQSVSSVSSAPGQSVTF